MDSEVNSDCMAQCYTNEASMNFSEYYEDRYKNQLNWFNKKSSYYKKLYVSCQAILIVASVVAPTLIKSTVGWIQNVAIALSLLSAVLGGILSCFSPFKLWQRYRMTAEAMVREYWMFKTVSGRYCEASDVEKCFIEGIEEILVCEHKDWIKMQEQSHLQVLNGKDKAI